MARILLAGRVSIEQMYLGESSKRRQRRQKRPKLEKRSALQTSLKIKVTRVKKTQMLLMGKDERRILWHF